MRVLGSTCEFIPVVLMQHWQGSGTELRRGDPYGVSCYDGLPILVLSQWEHSCEPRGQVGRQTEPRPGSRPLLILKYNPIFSSKREFFWIWCIFLPSSPNLIKNLFYRNIYCITDFLHIWMNKWILIWIGKFMKLSDDWVFLAFVWVMNKKWTLTLSRKDLECCTS